MAGIAGYLGHSQERHVLPSMVRKLSHRGVAREHFYQGDVISIGLRSNDPETGNMFVSQDTGLAVFFDGEIYNAPELKKLLEEHGFKVEGNNPAELMACLYQVHGTSSVSRLRGAFAFVLHDPQSNMVFMARDHLGLKPLYFTTSSSGAFIFASEIKAILEHPQISVVPDLMVMDAFLSLGFCPGAKTLFRGIHALLPAHQLIWNPGLHVEIEPYWDIEAHIKPEQAERPDKAYQERFNKLFEESVSNRAQTLKRPMGIVLNGDVASQAMALAMQRTGFGARLHSFSAVYKGDEQSGKTARDFSAKLGTKHEEVTVNPADMALLPEIIWALDLPVADPAAVLRYQLCRLAHQHVEGLVSEEGADDLLAGRPLHQSMLEAYQKPKIFYALIRPLVRFAPLALLNRFFSRLAKLGDGRMGETSRRRLLDFIDAMKRGDVAEQYLALSNVFGRVEKSRLYGPAMAPFMETYNDTQKSRQGGIHRSFLASLQALQRRQGIAESNLGGFEKMASLANIDARVPFADPALVAFMPSVPDHLKVSNGDNKILLKNYVAAYASNKTGAGLASSPQVPPFPFAAFTASPTLREMLNSCLSEENIKKRGLFDGNVVKGLLLQAKNGDALACRQVFALLTLELWFRIYVDHEKGWISAG